MRALQTLTHPSACNAMMVKSNDSKRNQVLQVRKNKSKRYKARSDESVWGLVPWRGPRSGWSVVLSPNTTKHVPVLIIVVCWLWSLVLPHWSIRRVLFLKVRIRSHVWCAYAVFLSSRLSLGVAVRFSISVLRAVVRIRLLSRQSRISLSMRQKASAVRAIRPLHTNLLA